MTSLSIAADRFMTVTEIFTLSRRAADYNCRMITATRRNSSPSYADGLDCCCVKVPWPARLGKSGYEGKKDDFNYKCSNELNKPAFTRSQAIYRVLSGSVAGGLLYPHEPGSDKIPQINVDIHPSTSHSLPDSCCSTRM